MVFRLLAVWKVQLLIIGILKKAYEQRLVGCLVVGWKHDGMTGLTQLRVLYQDKSSSIMTNWSCHHHLISCCHCTLHVLCSIRYWIGHSCLRVFGKISITFFYHMIPFYYALSSFFPHHVICPDVYSSLDP